jgi:DNA replication ATP-dependent helicase Dna2
VHLRERWVDVKVRPGDTVNIISPSLSSPIAITYKNPSTFLILHPDLMLTMTAIANAMPCPRKPILQSLIRIPGPSSKAILYGNLGHELLQGALADQEFSAAKTEERLAREMVKETTRLEVWGASMNMKDVQEEVGGRAGKGFQTFGQRWVGPKPRVRASFGRRVLIS